MSNNNDVEWAISVLADKGVGAIRAVETVVETSYSHVVRITTADGVYYLKKVPPGLFLEAVILKMLQDQGIQDHIPEIIGADTDRNCFLIKSCGDETLRTHFAGALQSDLVVQGVDHYKKIQKQSANYIQDFLDAGIPDLRFHRMPQLYHDLIYDKRMTEQWELSISEQQELAGFQPLVERLCGSRSHMGLPDVLNHSDFQDNNMVIDHQTGSVSIIDWGEVTIGNPLLPVLGCFKKMCRRYNVDETGSSYKELRNRFLDGWGIPEQDLDHVYQYMSVIDYICYAMNLVDLMDHTSDPDPKWGHRIKASLQSLMDLCRTL